MEFAVSVTVWPEAVNVNGEDGDAVTSLGKPERLTVTVPENPFCTVSIRLIFVLALGETETPVGFAAIEKLGGGAEELPPPLQPDSKSARTIALTIVAVMRANISAPKVYQNRVPIRGQRRDGIGGKPQYGCDLPPVSVFG
jgi:hypothetical protein